MEKLYPLDFDRPVLPDGDLDQPKSLWENMAPFGIFHHFSDIIGLGEMNPLLFSIPAEIDSHKTLNLA